MPYRLCGSKRKQQEARIYHTTSLSRFVRNRCCPNLNVTPPSWRLLCRLEAGATIQIRTASRIHWAQVNAIVAEEKSMDGYIGKLIRPANLAAANDQSTGRATAGAQESPPWAEPGVIDWDVAWANVEGDRCLLGELACIFLDDLPNQWEDIHRAAEQRQARDLERLAHRLKGALGNLGAKPAFEAAFQLEQIARQGDVVKIPAVMITLEREVRRLEVALAELANQQDQRDDAGRVSADVDSDWG